MRQNPTHTDSHQGWGGGDSRERKKKRREKKKMGGEGKKEGTAAPACAQTQSTEQEKIFQWGGEALSSTGCFFAVLCH